MSKPAPPSRRPWTVPVPRLLMRSTRVSFPLPPSTVALTLPVLAGFGSFVTGVTALVLAFRHGLRVSELIALRWDMVDLDACLLHVTRLKHGVASSHPLRGPEVRGLRRVKRDAPQSPYVFLSEREAPMTDSNFRKMLARAGRAAGFEFLVHPHMLRHATGYKLANDGQDTRAIQHYLGHKNIQHTVRYTELNSKRFNGFWKD